VAADETLDVTAKATGSPCRREPDKWVMSADKSNRRADCGQWEWRAQGKKT
jgi:hypothetical protein